MPGGISLIDLGELAKPATTLIEKISDAIGGIFRPNQIIRIAKAEAEADIIKAHAQIEITDLQRRALVRFITEEALKQDHIEKITQKALPQLKESSNPQNVENDWIANFFDKCRIVSDEEMQSLWAKVLAGEANSPGTYSKRTVNFLGSLDKKDAQLFTSLCGYCWHIHIEDIDNPVPLIFDIMSPIYNDQGIYFYNLLHLNTIGLISFDNNADFKRIKLPKRITISYYNNTLNLELKKDSDNELIVGKVIFTEIGNQLFPICGSLAVSEFIDYVVDHWLKIGLITSSPYPRLS